MADLNTNKKYLWHFRNFLIEHKVYRTFINNVESIDNIFAKQYGILSLKYLLSHVIPKSWIGYAFNWENTKQGHRFWENLDDEWMETLDDLEKIKR